MDIYIYICLRKISCAQTGAFCDRCTTVVSPVVVPTEADRNGVSSCWCGPLVLGCNTCPIFREGSQQGHHSSAIQHTEYTSKHPGCILGEYTPCHPILAILIGPKPDCTEDVQSTSDLVLTLFRSCALIYYVQSMNGPWWNETSLMNHTCTWLLDHIFLNPLWLSYEYICLLLWIKCINIYILLY